MRGASIYIIILFFFQGIIDGLVSRGHDVEEDMGSAGLKCTRQMCFTRK